MEAATHVGMILGTAAYMAPEQAKGKTVDKRADIWAFGVVLYEMLTGSRLFEGETVSDTLASVLKEEPTLDKVPIRARRLVQICLRKDPRQRLHDIGDARLHLDEAPPVAPRGREWLPWVTAALFCLTTVALAWLHFLWQRAPAPSPVAQFLLEPPGDAQFTNPYGSTAASPDGRYLVFAAGPGGRCPCGCARWIRSAPGPCRDRERQLPVLVPRQQVDCVLCGRQVEAERNCGWGAAGVVRRRGCHCRGDLEPRRGDPVRAAEGLFRVPASGGVPQQVTKLDAARKESGHGVPQFLPDGKRFLYFIQSADPNTQGIYAGSLDDPKERLRILATERKAYYVPPRAAGWGSCCGCGSRLCWRSRSTKRGSAWKGMRRPSPRTWLCREHPRRFLDFRRRTAGVPDGRCKLQIEDDLDEPGRQTSGRGGKGGPLWSRSGFRLTASVWRWVARTMAATRISGCSSLVAR